MHKGRYYGIGDFEAGHFPSENGTMAARLRQNLEEWGAQMPTYGPLPPCQSP